MPATRPDPPASKAPARLLPLVCAAASLMLASCAQYAKLTSKTPPFHPPSTTAGSLSEDAANLSAALALEKSKPLDAIGRYLDVTHAASEVLKRRPGDADALAAYNYSLSRAFGVLYEVRQNPWAEQISFPGRAGQWFVKARPDPRPQWKPSLYLFQPADEFELTGKYVSQRSTKPGLGAPLIVTSRAADALTRDQFAQGKNIFYGLTAIARFRGSHCEVSFEDPLAAESVEFQGHRFPLAADFTAPLAMAIATSKPQKLELSRLVNPAKFAETARLARLQPYDPAKTPIIVIHGLKDSQATWAPLVNALRADPDIRKHYQIWYYSYPSGYPYPHSAAILRRQLDAIAKAYPNHKDVVLIGHSMGGVISRTMVTDAREQLWDTLIGHSPDDLGMERQSLEILRDALVFRSRDDVSRVIYIAAPHRGSELASGWVGRIGSRLVRAPATLAAIPRQLKNVATLDGPAMRLNRMPNSVDTLSPDNRFVKAINTVPPDPRIPFHSIMGDRGKGGNLDRTKPYSSDGIVPYWSSHLDGAQSELIVPSNHSAHQHPQAIEGVNRILKQSARP